MTAATRTPTPTREIVVLGGGVGGTLVANLLARKLKPRQGHVTVIDRTGRHVYQPGWLYVPFGGPAPKRWERAERGLLSRKVDLVVGEARHIDRDGHTIQMVDGTSFPYDDLVIATGASLAPETIPGYAEAAHHFYSPEAAVRLRDALESFRGGKIVIGVADIPYKCPPAPLEFTFLLDEYLRKRGLREQTEITYLSPINRVFSIESVSTFVTPLLEERGIQHEEFFNTESIDPRAKTITSMEGTVLSYGNLEIFSQRTSQRSRRQCGAPLGLT
jgi:sulfide:quinone oxidoreductase